MTRQMKWLRSDRSVLPLTAAGYRYHPLELKCEICEECLTWNALLQIWSNYPIKVFRVLLHTKMSFRSRGKLSPPVIKNVCSRLCWIGEACYFLNVSRARHPELVSNTAAVLLSLWVSRRREGQHLRSIFASHHNHLHCFIFGKEKKVCNIFMNTPSLNIWIPLFILFQWNSYSDRLTGYSMGSSKPKLPEYEFHWNRVNIQNIYSPSIIILISLFLIPKRFRHKNRKYSWR